MNGTGYLLIGGVLLVPFSIYSLAHGIVFLLVLLVVIGILVGVWLVIRELVGFVKDAIWLHNHKS